MILHQSYPRTIVNIAAKDFRTRGEKFFFIISSVNGLLRVLRFALVFFFNVFLNSDPESIIVSICKGLKWDQCISAQQLNLKSLLRDLTRRPFSIATKYLQKDILFWCTHTTHTLRFGNSPKKKKVRSTPLGYLSYLFWDLSLGKKPHPTSYALAIPMRF